MKILIPTNKEAKSDGICASFGRAPYFMVVDTESGEETFVVNPGANSSGGAGVIASQAVVDTKVEAVLTPRIGKNSADVIAASGIVIYKSISENVDENIQLLKEAELEVLSDIHPGFHGHGE